MSDSLKVLIVCEHASSAFGGEAILPLNYFRMLSKTIHKPYLITHARVKVSLEQIEEIDQDDVFYIPDTIMHKFLFRCSSILPERLSVVTIGFLSHLVTQFYQWRIARKLVKSKKIDVVHEPAPVSATQPSAMFALGLPVIIGPMNGGMQFPEAFSHMAGRSEKIVYKLIPIFSTVYNILIPGKFFADLLLVANKRTLSSLPKLRRGRVVELVENGTFTTKNEPQLSKKKNHLNVIFVGRLIDLKAIDIAIDAISLSATNAKLTIVGDGPEKNKLEAYALEKNIKNIEFVGRVPHAQVNDYYDKADIFILPSVRECGGAVVLEAMSRGLPVIATNWGGPMDYITEETGYLVDPTSREYMMLEFARIIDLLSENPKMRYTIGMAAITRIKDHFLWDKKTKKMIEFYKEVVKNNG